MDTLTVKYVEPATNGNGGYHVVRCPEHPDADLIRTRELFDLCDHSWSCRCARGRMTYRCPDCNRTGGYTF